MVAVAIGTIRGRFPARALAVISTASSKFLVLGTNFATTDSSVRPDNDCAGGRAFISAEPLLGAVNLLAFISPVWRCASGRLPRRRGNRPSLHDVGRRARVQGHSFGGR